MRFYFNVRDELPIHDGLGREFDRVSDAVMHAKCLAADLRCLATDVRPHLSIQVIAEGSGQIPKKRSSPDCLALTVSPRRRQHCAVSGTRRPETKRRELAGARTMLFRTTWCRAAQQQHDRRCSCGNARQCVGRISTRFPVCTLIQSSPMRAQGNATQKGEKITPPTLPPLNATPSAKGRLAANHGETIALIAIAPRTDHPIPDKNAAA